MIEPSYPSFSTGNVYLQDLLMVILIFVVVYLANKIMGSSFSHEPPRTILGDLGIWKGTSGAKDPPSMLRMSNKLE